MRSVHDLVRGKIVDALVPIVDGSWCGPTSRACVAHVGIPTYLVEFEASLGDKTVGKLPISNLHKKQKLSLVCLSLI
jgi:hypothetical protein